MGLSAWLVYSIASKTVRLTLSLPLAPVIGLALAAAASAWLNGPAAADIWFNAAGIYVTGAVFFILASTMVQSAPQVKNALLAISAAIGLAAGAASFGINPAGSNLNLTTLILG